MSEIHAQVPTTAPMPADFDQLWNYRDPAGTEVRFRALLPAAAAAAVPDDEPLVIELWTQIARCQGLQRKFDDAHATLDRAEGLLQPSMKRQRVRYLLERGRVFNSGGQPARALPLFEAAWELAREARELRLAGDAIHMVAIAQPHLAGKVEWNRKAIRFVEENPPERGWLSALYNNLGEAYAEQGDHESALRAFRDLAALDVERGRKPQVYTSKDIAKMLRKLGRRGEAMAVLQPIADELARDGKPDGYIDEEMAECLLAEGREPEARPLFRRAYDAQKEDPWVVAHEHARLDRLRRLGGG